MSKDSEPRAADPFGGRSPTSHEQMTGRPWDASYHDGPPPGDIGRPQPISQEELRAAFNASRGRAVSAIKPERVQTRIHDNGAPAWFATIERTGTSTSDTPVAGYLSRSIGDLTSR